MEAVKQLIGRIEWISGIAQGHFRKSETRILVHLLKIGHSVRRMRDVNRFLLGIAEQIDLSRAVYLDGTRDCGARVVLVYSEFSAIACIELLASLKLP